jgi:hypothetical protein
VPWVFCSQPETGHINNCAAVVTPNTADMDCTKRSVFILKRNNIHTVPANTRVSVVARKTMETDLPKNLKIVDSIACNTRT